MGTLQAKVAIVTGAGRGIGRAVALGLASAGCRVALASRSADQLAAVADEIGKNGGEALPITADLTRDEEIEALVGRVLDHWRRIDILVNNAGWGRRAPVAKANVADWDQTLGVNLRAPMLLTRLVLPTMIARESGAIVNIGSIAGKSGEANASAYAASKFGLIGFTQSLFEEVREYGIKASVILPGFVDTPLIPETRRLDRAKMIRPEDVADTVMYVLRSGPACCPVEITLRPQRTPYR
ncbi:MAG TPA: SDR family oxidoreductase [Candidatus Eisenbacteria bacterium]|nr:SDR family oxidoreductase [Candidatus Eisenbacteria bacterium]